MRSTWVPIRTATYESQRLTVPRWILHRMLAFRGILDFLIVAAREPDVFLLQLSLWRGGGLRGLYQFRRLRELGDHLRTVNNSVIEFGTGASTLLIAKHARHAVSIEESEHWANRLRSALSNAWWIRRDLRKKTAEQIQCRSRKEWVDAEGELVCGYRIDDELLNQSWDFAYVDGPTNWPQEEHPAGNRPPAAIPNADVINFPPLPGEIWVDGRRTTLSYFSHWLPENSEVLTEMHLPRDSRRYFHSRYRVPEGFRGGINQPPSQ